jgi:hypothetical protein
LRSWEISLAITDGRATGKSNRFNVEFNDGVLTYEQVKDQENIINTGDGVMRISFECLFSNVYGIPDSVNKPFYVAMASNEALDPESPPKEKEPSMFSDLRTDHWAFDDIAALVDAGVLSGYPDGTFAPESNVKRSEFAKMMVVALDIPIKPITPTEENMTVEDYPLTPNEAMKLLDKSAWYYPSILSAIDYMDCRAYRDEYGAIYYNFEPEAPATRGEVAVALVKALELYSRIPPAEMSIFSDYEDIEVELRDDIESAYQYGIIHGYPDSTLRPDSPITRAEVFAMLNSVMNNANLPDKSGY